MIFATPVRGSAEVRAPAGGGQALLRVLARGAVPAARAAGLPPRGWALRRPSESQAEVGKQSQKTLLDGFGHYTEGYMTLFDTM